MTDFNKGCNITRVSSAVKLLCALVFDPLWQLSPVRPDSAQEGVITRDIHRTFPAHDYFKDSDGDGQDSLYKICKCFKERVPVDSHPEVLSVQTHVTLPGNLYNLRHGLAVTQKGLLEQSGVSCLTQDSESGFQGRGELYPSSWCGDSKPAYSVYDEEIGYCQGQSFLAAVLLLHMPEEQAFCVLVKIMYEYGLRALYKNNFEDLHCKFYQLERLMQEQLPDLWSHFQELNLEAHMYASQWFLTLFTAKFPLCMVFHITDLLLCEGLNIIFNVALALLKSTCPTTPRNPLGRSDYTLESSATLAPERDRPSPSPSPCPTPPPSPPLSPLPSPTSIPSLTPHRPLPAVHMALEDGEGNAEERANSSEASADSFCKAMGLLGMGHRLFVPKLLATSKEDLLQADFEGALKFFRVQLPKRYRAAENARRLMEQACNIKGILAVRAGRMSLNEDNAYDHPMFAEFHVTEREREEQTGVLYYTLAPPPLLLSVGGAWLLRDSRKQPFVSSTLREKLNLSAALLYFYFSDISLPPPPSFVL
ncbi:hypothetical protein NQZ68_004675 [Dissostichus eleginoides]|nr:hypothetical protein NQZ68_004675 [Dissostichus eleginoides]